MIASERPDRIQVAFDDHRLLANAGLLLPVTLAGRLGLSKLADSYLDLGDAPGMACAQSHQCRCLLRRHIFSQ